MNKDITDFFKTVKDPSLLSTTEIDALMKNLDDIQKEVDKLS